MDVTATDKPNLSQVTDMSSMFEQCWNLTGPNNINDWDVSNVRNMRSMFSSARSFNQPLNNWDVSRVEDMSYMFSGAESFNQPLDNWDVSNVWDMSGMFTSAESFNQPLDNWDVSNVWNMSDMFSGAESFNQPLDNWDVSNVRNMRSMFSSARSFNQPLDSWDVSNVRNMRSMFSSARSFNQPLNNWDVSRVEDMSFMFSGAESFNQPLDNWNVSNVRNMRNMFSSARSFNQPLNNWDVSNVDYFGDGFAGMFYYATSFDQNLGSWKMHPNTGYITLGPSGMSCENYTLTLIGWAANNLHLTNVSVDVYHTSYGPAADAAHSLLEGNGWIFNDDGLDESCNVTLPVVFGDISALYKNGQLQVNWTTLSELNNAYFEIEASVDGTNFVSIGTVQSLAKDGNSDQPLQYSFSKTASRNALLVGIAALTLAIGSFVAGRRKAGAMMLGACMLLVGIAASCNKKDSFALPAEDKDLYIRIKQVDKDGSYKYSKVVKVVFEH
jgi:bacterial surface protein 26-residue repeat